MKNAILRLLFLPLLLMGFLCTSVRAQTCDLGTNDWEGSSNANPPTGWVRGGGTPNISSSVTGEQDGVAVGFNTIGEFVYSPRLECVGSVTFDWHSSGQNSVFTVAVQWSQTPDNEATWQTFDSFSAVSGGGAAQTQYMEVTSDLPEASAAAPFFISVRWIMTARPTGSGTAYIDNICFESGTCIVTPTSVPFTDVPAACIEVGAPFTVTACATDDNGFVAETFTGDITLTNEGGVAVSGLGTMTAVSGCAVFTLTADAEGSFDLGASSAALVDGFESFSALALCPKEETIKVISYNILNFPNGRTPCEAAGDIVPPNRQDTLSKIMEYFAPDVLMVCELQTVEGSNAIIQSLQAVNASYQAATFIENQSSTVKNLNNMLYYNSAKMTLVEQGVIQTNTRDISHYRMRMNDPQIATAEDTAYVNFFVGHLKAGSAATDRQRRAEDVAIFQTIFDLFPLENSVFGGDMNFYESSEVAYQTLLNSTANPWFDPAMAPGDWDNDVTFADLHTQSARASGSQSYACGIPGGIDSRFDFLLMNGPINSETAYVEYIDGTYEVPGNNGNLFNQSINDASNSSGVPFDILNALFFMSDHLPVSMDLKVTYPVQSLPIDLMNFTAEATDEKSVQLNWTAANETAFSHYEVERLTNMTDWSMIGRVDGGEGAFTFIDQASETGTNNYRLRMVDLDGTATYSPVESVRLLTGLRIYPTVTTGDVWVGGAEIEAVRLIDALGRVSERKLSDGGRLSLLGLPKGWYVVQARTQDAGWVDGRVLLR